LYGPVDNEKGSLAIQVARFDSIRNTFKHGIFYYNLMNKSSMKEVDDELLIHINNVNLTKGNMMLILDNVDEIIQRDSVFIW